MRSARPLLLVIALVAVALAGYALGSRDDQAQPAAAPATTAAPPADSQATPGRHTQQVSTPGTHRSAGAGGATSTSSGTGQPVPRPRIFGFGSEPVLPQEGGFWQLPSGPGTLTVVTDAEHATKVEFLLSPTGTGGGQLTTRIGQDTTGGDGYLVNWRYPDRPLLAHLTVRATGPGGTTEHSVGVFHPDPELQP